MKNSVQHYGLLTILLHWLSAVTIIGLFGLGFWMVDLSYYDPWYKQGADLHRSIGILLAMVMIFRLFWRFKQAKVQPLNSHSKLEQNAAAVVHKLLYLIIFIIFASGYLISTADGRSIEVFQWFEIPSMGELFQDQADLSGVVHKYLAYSLITLVAIHAIGALKHHFIDKDKTLKRMLSSKVS
ncbi:cytochrome b [Thalassotalea sp. PLHSN55]|uniref:cytochrome b n=1 Tax=Thalassotalea sp. PLHSN55 TaxID=3435888 RepID=UPI003F85F9D5